MVRCETFGSNGIDDGGINRGRECEFDKMREPYEHQSPHWFRGLSYLKIGWNWINTSLTKNWAFLPLSSFTSNFDPDPAIASLKQHAQKFFRIKFSALTLDWAS
jgi:hypothetical protein